MTYHLHDISHASFILQKIIIYHDIYKIGFGYLTHREVTQMNIYLKISIILRQYNIQKKDKSFPTKSWFRSEIVCIIAIRKTLSKGSKLSLRLYVVFRVIINDMRKFVLWQRWNMSNDSTQSSLPVHSFVCCGLLMLMWCSSITDSSYDCSHLIPLGSRS